MLPEVPLLAAEAGLQEPAERGGDVGAEALLDTHREGGGLRLMFH